LSRARHAMRHEHNAMPVCHAPWWRVRNVRRAKHVASVPGRGLCVYACWCALAAVGAAATRPACSPMQVQPAASSTSGEHPRGVKLGAVRVCCLGGVGRKITFPHVWSPRPCLLVPARDTVACEVCSGSSGSRCLLVYRLSHFAGVSFFFGA